MLDWRWLGLYEYQNPRLLSVINYSEDIANLGGNRKKDYMKGFLITQKIITSTNKQIEIFIR